MTSVGPNVRALVGEEHTTRAVCVELKFLSTSRLSRNYIETLAILCARMLPATS